MRRVMGSPAIHVRAACALAGALALGGGLAAATTASPAKIVRKVPPPRSPAAPLVFGIYPGGGVGTVGAAGITRAQDPARRLAALGELRGDRPFVVHLYDHFRTRADAAAPPAGLAAEIAQYARAGLGVEVVLAYRPADPAGDPDGFADFVRARVRQFGAEPAVRHLQVTNEANVAGQPNASDGAYPGVRPALVRGVLAAADEARAAGLERIGIGFNWAFGPDRNEAAFFRELAALGGAPLAAAVDWVGVDVYPGTWGPALRRGPFAAAVRARTRRALRMLRRELLPLAGLERAAIHITETGWPTGARRSPARQRAALRAIARTAHAERARYGVTDLRWFSLQDADSSSPSLESGYGLLRDDGTPKPAFGVYRDLIRRLG